jgi:sulfur-oxidizing protein SoxY
MKADLAMTSRREFLGTLALGTVAAITWSTGAAATPEAVAAEAKKLFGDKAPQNGKIKLDVPTIAENGLVVPLGFEVESPMTDKDYVKTVAIFAEGNPNPQIATFHFTPLSPKAAAAIRVRLAQTQNIVVFAEMSNGDVHVAKKEVKVTIGGCGG